EVGAEESGPERLAGEGSQPLRFGLQLPSRFGLRLEDVTDLVSVEVDGWGDDVAGHLVGDLEDPLAEGGLDDCASCLLEGGVEAGGGAGWRPVSWVAIAFPFTRGVASRRGAPRALYELASAASTAECTCPPLATKRSAKRSSTAGRSARISWRMRRAARRSPS